MIIVIISREREGETGHIIINAVEAELIVIIATDGMKAACGSVVFGYVENLISHREMHASQRILSQKFN